MNDDCRDGARWPAAVGWRRRRAGGRLVRRARGRVVARARSRNQIGVAAASKWERATPRSSRGRKGSWAQGARQLPRDCTGGRRAARRRPRAGDGRAKVGQKTGNGKELVADWGCGCCAEGGRRSGRHQAAGRRWAESQPRAGPGRQHPCPHKRGSRAAVPLHCLLSQSGCAAPLLLLPPPTDLRGLSKACAAQDGCRFRGDEALSEISPVALLPRLGLLEACPGPQRAPLASNAVPGMQPSRSRTENGNLRPNAHRLPAPSSTLN